MKTIHELVGMPLVTVQEGIRLGTLKGVEFDAAEGRIRYLLFEGAAGRADGVLPWDAIRRMGSDAITVESVASVREAIPSAEQERVTPDVRHRPVLTESGTRLGTITGYDLDDASGWVVRYHVAAGGFVGRMLHREFSFSQDAIRSFGRDAIIVADEVATGGVVPPGEPSRPGS